MDKLLNTVASTVRRWMLQPAKIIHNFSHGKVSPNHITIVSFLGHFLVVWALWDFRPVLAAVLLAFFGIMDSLDGALAKVQKKASSRGMFYDAISDRAKEVVLCVGLAVYAFYYYDVRIAGNLTALDTKLYDILWHVDNLMPSVLLVLTFCGLSQLISYIKAKGELALSENSTLTPNELNKVFASGLARYEIRMLVIIVGLLTSSLLTALSLLIVVSLVTIFQRIYKVSKALK